ncbi:MAG: DinB family protein [Telluria sp.]
MSRTAHLRLMASYNQWMNERLYASAAALPAQALSADRKAFFGSILGTLNHIATGDILWLQRFATHPARHAALAAVASLPKPAALDEPRADGLPGLWELRRDLDRTILALSGEICEEELDHPISWVNRKGVASTKAFYPLMVHFFNHQTHHRGQVTTLLSQEGIDMGSTDLLDLIPQAG